MANKKVFYTLLVCFFLVMTGYGIVLPILPGFIQKIAGDGSYGYLSVPVHVGLITGIFPLMQFFFAPIWGKYSDIAGRFRVLAIGMAGYAVSLMLFGLVRNLLLLYVFRLMGGIFSAAVIPVINSYITDLTSRKQRGQALSVTGGAGSLGVIIGPMISSFLEGSRIRLMIPVELISDSPFALPFILAGLFSLAAVWVLYVISGNEVKQVRAGRFVQALINNRLDNDYHKTTLVIFGLAVMVAGTLSMFESTFSLHAGNTLGYGPYMMGFVFMICGLGMSLGQMGITGFLIARWGEANLITGSFLLIGIALLLLMLADGFAGVALAVGLLASGVALINPGLATLISKTSADNVGKRMGQLAGMNSMGLALGSFGGAGLYGINIHLPYLFFSVSSVLVFVFLLRCKKVLNKAAK